MSGHGPGRAGVHLLVVGPPGGCEGVLRVPDPAARVTVLCTDAEAAAWPDLRDIDQLLTVDLSHPEGEVLQLARAVGARQPITHVVSFQPRHHRRARRLAEAFEVPVAPRLARSSTGSAGLRDTTGAPGSTSFLVPVLAEGGDLEPVAIIGRSSRAGGVVGHVVPAVGQQPGQLAELVETATTAVAEIGLQTGVAVAYCSPTGVQTPVELPGAVELRLMRRSTGWTWP